MWYSKVLKIWLLKTWFEIPEDLVKAKTRSDVPIHVMFKSKCMLSEVEVEDKDIQQQDLIIFGFRKPTCVV